MKIKHAIYAALIISFAMTTSAWAEDLRAEMEAANSEWLAAFNNSNGAAFTAMYTKDAVFLPPGTQPIIGAEAVARFFTERLKDGKGKNHTFEIISIQRDRNYAYQVARWTLDLVKDNGEMTKVAGNSVRIFEKQPDGRWLIKVHIFNAY